MNRSNTKPGFRLGYVLDTTVDGQNIQTLQHALCWTPAPPNLNVSARVLAKVMLGVWFFSSIGANALQATITLNFGGEGVVPDRRGLNISSIYGREGIYGMVVVLSCWRAPLLPGFSNSSMTIPSPNVYYAPETTRGDPPVMFVGLHTPSTSSIYHDISTINPREFGVLNPPT